MPFEVWAICTLCQVESNSDLIVHGLVGFTWNSDRECGWTLVKVPLVSRYVYRELCNYVKFSISIFWVDKLGLTKTLYGDLICIHKGCFMIYVTFSNEDVFIYHKINIIVNLTTKSGIFYPCGKSFGEKATS